MNKREEGRVEHSQESDKHEPCFKLVKFNKHFGANKNFAFSQLNHIVQSQPKLHLLDTVTTKKMLKEHKYTKSHANKST